MNNNNSVLSCDSFISCDDTETSLSSFMAFIFF